MPYGIIKKNNNFVECGLSCIANTCYCLQVLSSTNGDLLADEIVNENPNPPTAAPVDVEVIEETKYDQVMLFNAVVHNNTAVCI